MKKDLIEKLTIRSLKITSIPKDVLTIVITEFDSDNIAMSRELNIK